MVLHSWVGACDSGAMVVPTYIDVYWCIVIGSWVGIFPLDWKGRTESRTYIVTTNCQEGWSLKLLTCFEGIPGLFVFYLDKHYPQRQLLTPSDVERSQHGFCRSQ